MSRKDTGRLLAELRRQGFAVRLGGSGHWRVTSPGGKTATVPATPSDYRSLANTRAHLRRLGARL